MFVNISDPIQLSATDADKAIYAVTIAVTGYRMAKARHIKNLDSYLTASSEQEDPSEETVVNHNALYIVRLVEIQQGVFSIVDIQKMHDLEPPQTLKRLSFPFGDGTWIATFSVQLHAAYTYKTAREVAEEWRKEIPKELLTSAA